jgi:hypothetical protein
MILHAKCKITVGMMHGSWTIVGKLYRIGTHTLMKGYWPRPQMMTYSFRNKMEESEVGLVKQKTW